MTKNISFSAMKATGRNDGLCQDYNRKLHQWFASKLDARYVVRLVCAEIERNKDEIRN